jgi:hypothetical protein
MHEFIRHTTSEENLNTITRSPSNTIIDQRVKEKEKQLIEIFHLISSHYFHIIHVQQQSIVHFLI